MISYSYPTLQQAEEAGLNLLPQLTGRQPRDVASGVQDCYTLAGYGLSLGLPVPHVARPAVESSLAECLAPLTSVRGAGLNLDWKQILKFALQLILQTLG